MSNICHGICSLIPRVKRTGVRGGYSYREGCKRCATCARFFAAETIAKFRNQFRCDCCGMKLSGTSKSLRFKGEVARIE